MAPHVGFTFESIHVDDVIFHLSVDAGSTTLRPPEKEKDHGPIVPHCKNIQCFATLRDASRVLEVTEIAAQVTSLPPTHSNDH